MYLFEATREMVAVVATRAPKGSGGTRNSRTRDSGFRD